MLNNDFHKMRMLHDLFAGDERCLPAAADFQDLPNWADHSERAERKPITGMGTEPPSRSRDRAPGEGS